LDIINFKLISDFDKLKAGNGIVLNKNLAGIILKYDNPRIKIKLYTGDEIDGNIKQEII
jgi:hypothetical protein